MKVVGISDTGRVRQKNEDRYLIDESLGVLVVCDGMGGHRGGDVASNLAIRIIKEGLEKSDNKDVCHLIEQSILEANRVIWQSGHENPEWYEMGTTVTAAVLGGNQLTVYHVGDSRLYIIGSNHIRQVTNDHTLAKQMLADGLLAPSEIRGNPYNHILTRALGVEDTVIVDTFNESITSGEYILLCSDGLSDMLEDKVIMEIVTQENQDINKAAQGLVKRALEKGGFDNITVLLLRV